MKKFIKAVTAVVVGYLVLRFLGTILLVSALALIAGYLGISYVIHKKFKERP